MLGQGHIELSTQRSVGLEGEVVIATQGEARVGNVTPGHTVSAVCLQLGQIIDELTGHRLWEFAAGGRQD